MNALEDIIRREIEARGPLPLARFMELALYHPLHGYYERAPSRVGRRGDYVTSVSVGPLFGELLASQFALWLDAFHGPCQVVEAGAHDGRLAHDILTSLHRRDPRMARNVAYWIIEPSARRRAWQAATLEPWHPNVAWFPALDACPHPVTGVIFANELLDALPLHRIAWDRARRAWVELRVGLQPDTRLGWIRVPSSTRAIDHAPLPSQFPPVPEPLAGVLPDGFVTEVSPAAIAWWRLAAARLSSGRLVTIDYGLESAEFLVPGRAAGTLRAYHEHRLSVDPLAHAGEQDLTAHVDFGALQRAGEELGLETEFDCSQEAFLTQVARALWNDAGEDRGWDAKQRRQFTTLTHPDHFGRAFRVLAQRRRVPETTSSAAPASV
jgi:SAM-dependent MidA family methyltransferase